MKEVSKATKTGKGSENREGFLNGTRAGIDFRRGEERGAKI